MLGDFEIFPFAALEEAEMLLRISLAALVGGIWVAAALGMAAGSGLYVLAIGGAVLAMVILAFFPRKPGHGNGDEEEDKGVQLWTAMKLQAPESSPGLVASNRAA